jgi:hypothetical protein
LTLIERYGPGKNMVDLRLILATGFPKIAAGKVMDTCAASTISTVSEGEKSAGRAGANSHAFDMLELEARSSAGAASKPDQSPAPNTFGGSSTRPI